MTKTGVGALSIRLNLQKIASRLIDEKSVLLKTCFHLNVIVGSFLYVWEEKNRTLFSATQKPLPLGSILDDGLREHF